MLMSLRSILPCKFQSSAGAWMTHTCCCETTCLWRGCSPEFLTRHRKTQAMDEHLVKCEAIGEEDSWGYDASSSSLDITDGIEELDDSGGDPAPVSTSLATSTGIFQTYRRVFSFLCIVLDELVVERVAIWICPTGHSSVPSRSHAST
jgi:hypothetical protein